MQKDANFPPLFTSTEAGVRIFRNLGIYNLMDIGLDDIKFCYHSPSHFLDVVQSNLENVLQLENGNNSLKLILIQQCNFVVMCAAAIESHLNWYFYFDQKIDVDKVNTSSGMYMSISDKIKNSPLENNTKGGCRAIFKLRDQVMHAKYKPRNARQQFMYSSAIMLLSFKTLTELCSELIKACPTTLKGRIFLSESQKELSAYSSSITLTDKEGKKINWIEAVNTGCVALPIPSIGHVVT